MVMDNTQVVDLGYGKAILKSEHATVASLRLRAPFIRDSAVDTAKKIPGRLRVTPVSSFPKINGNMINQEVHIPDGTIIMIQVDWKRGATLIRQGVVLLRTREAAAVLNVIAKLPVGRESIIGDSHSVFRGNADILSPEELAVYRIQMPSRYISQYFNADELDECFEVKELAAARSPRPVAQLVSTPEGLVTTEVAAPARRRIIIRR